MKVTLFQASAENSEPTCATATMVISADQRDRAADAHLHRVQRTPSRIAPEVRAEVGGDGLRHCVPENAQQNQPHQRRGLGESEDVLHQRAQAHAEDVQHRRKTTITMAARFCVFRPDIHVAQHHGAERNRRHMPKMNEPVGGGNGRKEDAEKLAEGDAHRGDGARLDDQKERPAVEKAPQRTQRFAQIDVLAAGVGHHRRQLAVGQRAGDGHESGDQPGGDQQGGRIAEAGDIGGDNEDARADHGAHDQRGGAGKAQTFYKPTFTARRRLSSSLQLPRSLIPAERRSQEFTPTPAGIPQLLLPARAASHR